MAGDGGQGPGRKDGVAEKRDELKLRFNSSCTFFIPRFSNAGKMTGPGFAAAYFFSSCSFWLISASALNRFK